MSQHPLQASGIPRAKYATLKDSGGSTDTTRMDSTRKRRSNLIKPGLLALESSGDGFWELDLVSGSAWFSEWLYQKLGWSTETGRTTLADLEPVLEPGGWPLLMSRIRAHLERAEPLNVVLEVRVGAALERWRLRGRAHRNSAGQPLHLAGSLHSLDDEHGTHAPSPVRAAFEALPIAAALLDAHAMILEGNREWRAFPEAVRAQAIARLRAANSQTAIEFWLDQDEGLKAARRRVRVRAIAFEHEASQHLAVTLEDRRSD